MSRRVWLVIENTPGYLPDSEPASFTNRREAERYAASLAADLREAGYRVRGNARDGYYGEQSPNDLGRVIEIHGKRSLGGIVMPGFLCCRHCTIEHVNHGHATPCDEPACIGGVRKRRDA